MTKRHSIHPLYILITLILASITALFLGFTGAYMYSRIQGDLGPVHIPHLFYWNTLFMLGASFTLIQTKKAYDEDNTSRYILFLRLTLVCSLIFLVSQALAWNQMIQMNVQITSSPLASYLYVISGLHFTHLTAGLPFLILFLMDARQRLVEPASVLVYLSDPDKKRKLRVLTIYWHFLDALWIYLVFFFLVNSVS